MITVILEKHEGNIGLNELVNFQNYLFCQLTQALKRRMTEYEGNEKALGSGWERSKPFTTNKPHSRPRSS